MGSSSHYSNDLGSSYDPDDPDEFNGFPMFDIASPVVKRRRLSTLNAIDISNTFQPELYSTLTASVLEPQISFATQLETDCDASEIQDSLDNVTGPDYNETPVASHPSSQPSIHDPVPRCELQLGNQQESYYVLSRESSIRKKNIITQHPAGYAFVRECRRDRFGRDIWKCVNCSIKKGGCKCRIDTPVFYDDPNEPDQKKVILDVQVRGGSFHTCIPEGSCYIRLELRKEQIRLGIADHHRGAGEIVTATMEEDYDPVRLPVDMPRAKFATTRNMARVVNHQRFPHRAVQPTKDNLADFPIDMDDQNCKNFVRVSWVTENKKKNGGIDKHRSVFCCTDEQLEWLRGAKHLKIDGTFKMVKGPFYQLVSLHRLIDFGHDSKSMPVGFIIMSGKSQADYTDIFQQIKLYVEEDGNSWNIESAMLDFELALRNALKKVFVGIHLEGCWFHYCQAIWRRVQKLKLDGMYPHKDHGGKYIKRLMALALMNSNDSMIQKMFKTLQDCFEIERIHMTPDVATAFGDLLDYVGKQWIHNTKIPTSELSVFDTPVRTNNEVENWNGQTWGKCGKKALHFYSLIKTLRKHSKSTRGDIRMEISNTKKATQVLVDKKIQDVWDQMKAKSIPPKKALFKLCQITESNNVMQYNANSLEYTCDDVDDVDVDE